MDRKLVAAVLEDPEQAPIEERLRAGLAIAEAMTTRPGERYADVIARARGAGLDDEAIEDAANVAFHFNYINRVSDALDFELPSTDKVPVLARLLDRAKVAASKQRPSPSTITTDDGIVRPVEVQVGHEAMLGAPATVDPALRTAVESFTARLRGGRRPELAVPEDLHRFLEKLALDAYKITDDDFETLHAAGRDKDALLEIINAGAWGASIPALENILADLQSTRPEAARERATA
jgi:alkylhydroperoxidase family enzyme